MTKFLSPTSINTYLRCPRKYYLRYIKGLKEKNSIHLIRGKAVHDSIARLCQRETKRSDIEEMRVELLSLFKHAWSSQEEEIRRLDLPEGASDEYYSESCEMLMGWLKRHMKAVMEGQTRPETEVKLFSQTHRVMGSLTPSSNRMERHPSLIIRRAKRTNSPGISKSRWPSMRSSTKKTTERYLIRYRSIS